jgi:DNA-binding beta-propeller fold protein YncE
MITKEGIRMKNVAIWSSFLFLAGCAADSDMGAWDSPANAERSADGEGAGSGPGYWQCFSANDCPPGQYCNEFHTCQSPPVGDAGPDGDPWVPPEVEEELGSPASGLRYVYVPLTDLDGVARIDSESLDVTTVPVGDRPRVLTTPPGQDLAVVLNHGSDSATVVRTVDGEDQTVTLPTPAHANRLEMNPSGTVAIAYFEAESAVASDWGSFQDVAVLRLAAGEDRVQRVTVGFRPRQVIFGDDDESVFVITEDGVSILDLADETMGFVAPTIPLSLSLLEEGVPEEVLVSPDGSHAFSRWADEALVRAVDLTTGTIVDTALDGVPTDLDLTPAGDAVVMVLRDAGQVVVMDLPDGIGDVDALNVIDCSDLEIGSALITPDGQRALVFTNAINQESLAVVDLSTGDVRLVLLRKGVRTVLLSPGGTTALVIHNSVPLEPGTNDFEATLDGEQGFSLLNLSNLFVKLQVTQGQPGVFTFLPDELGAYIVVADESVGLREVAAAHFGNFTVDTFSVGSEPTALGTVPGTNRVYVVQDHPLGRISFVEIDSQTVRTVTGFQLNSQIIE